jgi:putative SOS response-associated peptidase YedK
MGYRMINARAETIADKPSFRRAFKTKRCLIPANGFYEWRRSDKQPFFIRPAGAELFSFAGIWEQWKDPEENLLETCSIITTEPNEFMSGIHERMPVILQHQDEEFWISNETRTPEILLSLLKPYPEEIEAIPVSKQVNSTRNNYEQLLQPVNL